MATQLEPFITKSLKDQLDILKNWMPVGELKTVWNSCFGEESKHFRAIMAEFTERIMTMPKTYEQDGKGKKAIVYLHYFLGNMDWYITEKDSDPDGEGQIQAFGLADIGYGGELGYISIPELISCNVELDLYWTPKTLEEIPEK